MELRYPSAFYIMGGFYVFLGLLLSAPGVHGLIIQRNLFGGLFWIGAGAAIMAVGLLHELRENIRNFRRLEDWFEGATARDAYGVYVQMQELKEKYPRQWSSVMESLIEWEREVNHGS